jgi:hypothetical protein
MTSAATSPVPALSAGELLPSWLAQHHRVCGAGHQWQADPQRCCVVYRCPRCGDTMDVPFEVRPPGVRPWGG